MADTEPSWYRQQLLAGRANADAYAKSEADLFRALDREHRLLATAMDALRDAIDAATRQGVNVHWDVLTPKLCAAHDAIARYMEPKE